MDCAGGIKSTNLLRTLHGRASPTGHAPDGAAVVSDIMAEAEAEQADLARMPGGLLIKFGTIDALDGMLAAGSHANQNGKPVVFDLLGVGATATSEHLFFRVLFYVLTTVPRATRCVAADGDQGKCSGNWRTRRLERGPPTRRVTTYLRNIFFFFFV